MLVVTCNRPRGGAPGARRPRWYSLPTVLGLCAVLLMMPGVALAKPVPSAVAAPSISPTPDDLVVALASTMQVAATVARVLPRASGRPATDTSQARWTWPLLGPQVLISPFDGPAQRWLPGHRGVDLAGFDGAPVRAVEDGVVSFSGVINGVGVVSVIHDGGLLSTYQPVMNRSAKGQAVRGGEMIGTLAANGSHCWPLDCLHLGARRGKDYLDPMMFLRPWVVSLLPP